MQNSYRKLLFYISGIVFFSCILGYIVFNVYMIATVSKKSREQIVPYARRKLILLVNGTTHFFCFVGTMDDDWRFVMIHLLLSIVWMCALLRIRWVGSDFFVPILAETNVRMLELISILWIMMIFIYLFSKFFNIKRDQVQSSIKN